MHPAEVAVKLSMVLKKALTNILLKWALIKRKKLWDMSLEAIDIIDERITKYGIQCDWKKGYATLALNERRMGVSLKWKKLATRLLAMTKCNFGIKPNLNNI